MNDKSPSPNTESQIAQAVAVVCPGPGASLIRGREDFYSRIVAVNRAVLTVSRCEYWVCLDSHTADWVCEHAPRFVETTGTDARKLAKNIVCSLAEYRSITSRHPVIGRMTNVEHTSLNMGETEIPWKKFGASVALAVAAEGAPPPRQIDCYGVAWDGERDFDGFSSGRQRRDADRWAEDRRVWTATAELLIERGIEIRRMVCELRPVGAEAAV